MTWSRVLAPELLSVQLAWPVWEAGSVQRVISQQRLWCCCWPSPGSGLDNLHRVSVPRGLWVSARDEGVSKSGCL